METREQQIARFKDFIKVGTDGLKELGEHDEGTTDITSKHRVEDASTSLFEKMTSAELMELYQTDRAKWQEVMDSVQSAGERKLAKLQSRM